MLPLFLQGSQCRARFQPYCPYSEYHRKIQPTVLRSKWRGGPRSEVGRLLQPAFCWPVAIIEKPSLGILTPTYRKNFFFKSGKLKGKDKNGKWFSNQKLRKFLPPKELGDWYGYFHFVCEWPELWPNCNVTGLAHSDLSNNNVLWIHSPGSAR